MTKTRTTKRRTKRTRKTCFRCGGKRLVEIVAKCNDMCRVSIAGTPVEDGRQPGGWGYVPDDIGLGDHDDHIEFTYCRDCGQMQNDEFKTR